LPHDTLSIKLSIYSPIGTLW